MACRNKFQKNHHRFIRKTLQLACATTMLSLATAWANEQSADDTNATLPPPSVLTPDQIEARLQAARAAVDLNDRFVIDEQADGVIVDYQKMGQDLSVDLFQTPESSVSLPNISPNNPLSNLSVDLPVNTSITATADTPQDLSALPSAVLPISRIDGVQTPVGLDRQAADEMIAVLSQSTEFDLSALSELSKLGDQELILLDEPKKDGAVRRLYNRLFNDGVGKVPRLKVHLYQAKQAGGEPESISKNQQKQEPYANMKAVLENVTQESVTDFKGSLPRLRQEVLAAARAVGYYDVDFRLVRHQAGEVNLIIDRLGEPVRVDNRALEVRGDGADNQAYRAVLDANILQAGDVFDHGKYEASKSAIESISGEQGFLDGKWLNNSVDVVLPDNIADVSLIYDTGVQYQFDEVVFITIDPATGELTADPDKLPVKAELLQKLLTFQMGDAYNRQAVRDLSNDLLATGYFNATNTEVIFPDHSASANTGVNFENTAKESKPDESVSETVDLGDGVTADIAPIEFSASEAIKDKLALITQKADRLYNLPDDRLLAIDGANQKSTTILGKISDAIGSVVKAILPDESKDNLFELPEGMQRPELANKKTAAQVFADKKVPLYIFVMADKPRDAHLGVGWGSDSGARFVSKFEHNLINKDGYQAGAELRLSENKQGVKLYASKPLSHPLNDKLQASLSYNHEVFGQSLGGFDLSSQTLEQGISRNIINKNGWNRSYSLRYRLDELKTKADPSTWQDLPVNFLNGTPKQQALLAGFAMHKTVADNLVNPMRGYRQYYSLEAGIGGLATDTDMAIAKAGVSGVHSFGDNAYGKDRAHQVSASLQGGYIWAKDFNAVPYKLRFFAGGDQSVRGYNYNSLSPVSDNGYLTGGQALAVGSAEYSYELMKDFRLAVFADMGGAYDRTFSNDTKIGAGVGIRWASPVGQVRADIATGVKEQDTQIKLHFFIGSPF